MRCLIHDCLLGCVQENVSPNGFVVDRKDSSITRTREVLEAFFTQAGLMVRGTGSI